MLAGCEDFPAARERNTLETAREKDMTSKFYIVQKAGTPAVWQSDPQQIERLLRHKAGFTVVSTISFSIEVDLPLLLQNRVLVQEGPIFCLQLLTAASVGGLRIPTM